MNINVRLFSRLREALPPEAKGEAIVELPLEATVSDLLAHLGIEGRIKLIVVNDEAEPDRERILQDGDRIRVYPIVVGG